MTFSLIVCTYMRAKPLVTLLQSVSKQTVYPNEIIIVDGSTNTDTELALKVSAFKNLKYLRVNNNERGLTKQRNIGVELLDDASEIVCFLDDDIVLKDNYFEILLNTYQNYPKALAVGGYIVNEVNWKKTCNQPNGFSFDGWTRNEPSRFKIRKRFGLLPDANPGFLPTFAHGRAISFLPPSNKVYEVEQIMGGVSSYKSSVFKEMSFSEYFKDYGLYEDTDFSLRLAKKGQLYINTSAQLYHYHDYSGRPNAFKYGKMVVRNGWYVWRVKYPKPNVKARIKWNATSFLLTLIRFTNVFTSPKKKNALQETFGRFYGWISILFNAPK